MRLRQQRRNQAANIGKRQPQTRHGSISGYVNQVRADCRSEASEKRRGQAVGQREARGPHAYGHDLGQEHDHRAVVATVNKGEPQFDGEKAREGRLVDQPEHGWIGGEQHQQRASDQRGTTSDSV